MRILVACEESQRVCIEFRRLGHEAYSCDIEPCSGGHPEWHIQSDVLPLLNGNCSFRTVDKIEHKIYGKWDMIIAFPPCTYFSTAGANWLFIVEPDSRWVSAGYKGHSDNAVCKSSGSKKKRSTTFLRIAEAMAEQWGKVDEPPKPQYHSVPRHSWQHYGISKERYRQLTEYIRSGRYTSVARQAAHTANEMIAEYILLSVTQNKSYDALRVKWELKEMERIPYCRTDFYGIRRHFFSIFNEKMKEIGK